MMAVTTFFRPTFSDFVLVVNETIVMVVVYISCLEGLTI